MGDRAKRDKVEKTLQDQGIDPSEVTEKSKEKLRREMSGNIDTE